MDETNRPSRFRSFSLKTALFVLLLCAVVSLLTMYLAAGLGFTPGWARGWPGVSMPTAFASVMTGLLAVAALGAGGTAVALPCHYLERRLNRAYAGWSAFAVFMLAWAAGVAVFSVNAYTAVRDKAVHEQL